MRTSKIFVYGTLKRAFPNEMAAFLHQNSQFVGQAWAPGLLVKVSWYPGLIYDAEKSSKVYGEVFDMSQPRKMLAVLDDYEGISKNYQQPYEYRREVIAVETESGTQECWAYLYAGNQVKEVLSSGHFVG